MALGEFDLIRAYFEPLGQSARKDLPGRTLIGIGDDCAVLDTAGARLAVSVDTLVAGRHFLPDMSAADIAWRALHSNLSDLAGMGATPRWFTLALSMAQADPVWLEGFARGLGAAASGTGVELVGGDTVQGPLSVTIQVTGLLEGPALTRDAAQNGDDIWVSGVLGEAAAGLMLARQYGQRMPDFGADSDEARAWQRFARPVARNALGQDLARLAHACMDVSDGVAGDLLHILKASSKGAELWLPRVPVSPLLAAMGSTESALMALGWGDDYELLFTAAPEKRSQVATLAARHNLLLSRIGVITAGEGLSCLDAQGRLVPLEGGHQHFGGRDE
jgi:thiamine-monophosphate kinase